MLSGGKPTISPASHDNARGAAIAVKPDFEYRAVRAGSGLPDDDSMAASGQNRKRLDSYMSFRLAPKTAIQ